MDKDIVESLRLFGVPTAAELRREFARESKRKERALAGSEIHRKKTIESFINLFSNVWCLLRKKARVVKAKF